MIPVAADRSQSPATCRTRVYEFDMFYSVTMAGAQYQQWIPKTVLIMTNKIGQDFMAQSLL